MAPFYGWGSTASRLQPLWGGSLLFTNKFPEIPGTHFIDLGNMKGWVDLGATQWFWTQYLWSEPMGRATPVYNENFLEVPLWLSFMAYLLNSNLKSQQNAILLSCRTNFFHAPKILMVSEFHCPKTGKNNSNFRIVNLSNSGTKDFVELWEIRHLNI